MSEKQNYNLWHFHTFVLITFKTIDNITPGLEMLVNKKCTVEYR